MTDYEQQDAALELARYVETLIHLKEIPDYMHDFLMARVIRVRRSFGVESKQRERA